MNTKWIRVNGNFKTGLKRKGTLLAALLAVTGLLAGCAQSSDSAEDTSDSSDSGLRTLRVAVMTGQPDQYAIAVGEEQGIFEKYNIDVETTEYVAGINTIDAVVNGTADTGMMADYAAANRLGNTLEDTNLVIFSELAASDMKNGGLYVAPEYADDLDSLDGSTGFITQTGTVTDYYVSTAIEYLGLEEENQNLISTDSTQTALALVQQDNASAYIASGSNASYVEEYGWVLAVPAEDLGIRTGSYLLTTDEFLESNTELLADYMTALQESIDYINDNLDDVSVEMASEFGVEADDFVENWTAQEFMIGLSVEGAEHLQELEDWAYAHGRFPQEYEVTQFYNAAAAEIAFPDRSTYE